MLAALVAAGAAAAATPAATSPQPLQTAIVDPNVFTGPDANLWLARAAAAGVSVIKVPLFWNGIAPATPPPGFTPSNPSDPAYSWTGLDTELRAIASHGLVPDVYIAGPPTWARTNVAGFSRPDPNQYAAFALAAVRRYSGTVPGLPRVRYWQAWNEPNKVPGPAYKATQPTWYRALVNAFATSVHSVPGNLVVAGALSPFGISTAEAPLTFMRSLLCVSAGATPHATCSTPVHFDVWSTDPYTEGSPTRKALAADDVSIAELPQMKSVLDAGVRLGHIASRQPVAFWVTEFSWDSNPPNRGGVPIALEARWVSQALYEMWSAGVSLATWFTFVDEPLSAGPYQSGLYYMGASAAAARPKPALTAFRFPFVALPGAKGIGVWGRTPGGAAGTVLVEQQASSGWKRLAVLQANRVGIFSGELASSGKGPLRAQFPRLNATSIPFSLVSPPDANNVYHPFGATHAGGAGSAGGSSSAVSQYVEAVPTAGGATPLAQAPSPTTLAGANPSSLRPPSGAPGTALTAALDAVDGGGGGRAAAFAAVALVVTLSLAAAAMRTRRARARRP